LRPGDEAKYIFVLPPTKIAEFEMKIGAKARKQKQNIIMLLLLLFFFNKNKTLLSIKTALGKVEITGEAARVTTWGLELTYVTGSAAYFPKNSHVRYILV